MATMQICKPAQVNCDQPKNPKIGQNNEKKHHFHFWQKNNGNQENKKDQATKKHQHDNVAVPPNNKQGKIEHKIVHWQPANSKHQHENNENPKHGTNNEHKNNNNKQHHDVMSYPRAHKISQCFGHGANATDSDVEETETVVIERKIKERVVITNVKKCHDHKEGGAKHLDRC